MTHSDLPTPTPPRRSFLNIAMMLVMFYLLVFAALHIMQFEFPFTILYTLFFLIAVPLGLFVVGSIHFLYLLRLRLGSRTAMAPAPGKLASVFVGTTVVICAYLVSIYPQWRAAASETWATTIAEKMPPAASSDDRDLLANDVRALWLRYWRLIEVEGTDTADNYPELTKAFQYMVSTATSPDPMSEKDYHRLRTLVPGAQGVTRPEAATR